MLSMQEIRSRLSYLILGQRGGQNRIQIIQALKERPYNLNQLAEMLDLNYRTIKHHIDSLLKHEIITTTRGGGYGSIFFLSPEIENNYHLLEDVIQKFHNIITSPKFFQNVLEQINDAVSIIGLETEVIFWNESADRLYGYKKEDIIGKHLPIFKDKVLFKSALNKIEMGQKAIDYETIAIDSSGKELVVEVTIDGIRNDDNALISYSIITTDISERKMARDALLLSEKRYSLAQKAANIGSWEWNIVTGEIIWSETLEPMFGFAPGKFKSTFDAFVKCVHPDDRKKVQDAINGTLKKNKRYDIMHRIIWPDGTIRWIAEKGEVFKDDKGKPLKMIGIAQDLTERISTELKFMTIFESAMDGLEITDPAGNIIEVNDATCRILGYSRKELLRMSIDDIRMQPPSERANHKKIIMEKKEDRFEVLDKAKSGELINVEICARFLDIDGGLIVNFVRDISQHKKTQQALAESEERLRTAQVNAESGIWDWDIKTNKLYFSPQLEKLYGLTPGTIKTYSDWKKRVYPDDIKMIEKKRDEAVAKHKPFDLEFRVVLPSGGHRWLTTRGKAVYDEKGKPCRITGLNVDISDLKQMEQKLQNAKDDLERRVQERTKDLERANRLLLEEIAEHKLATESLIAERERLYNVLETMPAYLILLTPDYHIPFANRFFRERFGESHGRKCYEYLFNRTEPCEVCHTYDVMKTKAPLEWDWTGPDGHDYHIYDYPFKDEDGSPLILEIGIDVTEYKITEKECQKLKQELKRLTGPKG